MNLHDMLFETRSYMGIVSMNYFVCNLISVWCNSLAVDAQLPTTDVQLSPTRGLTVFTDSTSAPDYPYQ